MSRTAYYRFELIRKNRVVDFFNMILPYTLSYEGGYRDNVQKTFGGTHIDVTGMDNETITLTGTVAGKRPREGWAKNGGAFTGLEAIKYFRDNIWKYPVNPRYKGYWKDMSVKFYDLDMGDRRWIHINKVSIVRDKAQPFWYNFTVQFTDIGPPKKNYPDNKLTAALEAYKKKLQGVSDSVNNFNQDVSDKLAEFESYVDTVLGFADVTIQTATDILNSVTDLLLYVTTFPGRVIERTNETATRCLDAALALDEFVDNNVNFLGYEYGEYLRHTAEELSFELNSSAREFRAVGKKRKQQAAQEGALVNELSTADLSIEAGVENSLSNSQSESLEKVEIKTTKTLEDVAEELYGDEKMSRVLAEINNLDTIFIPKGTILLCPIYRSQNDIPDNQVIDETGEDLGRDIALKDKLMQAGAGGDLLVVGGFDNMKQAVTNIYNRPEGSLPSDREFGYDAKSIVAAPGIEIRQRLATVKDREALLKDPRIADVTDITYNIDEDVRRRKGRIVLSNDIESIPFTV